MSSVDSRIVEMRFDNDQFERGVATTITSLEELQKKLNLENSTNGFNKVQAAVNDLSLDGISTKLDELNDHFDFWGIASIAVIERVTNKLLDMAETAATALFIDPVTTGLQEYETMIGSTQTIYNNVNRRYGRSLEDVNVALDELNAYADQTVYNFTQMTNAAGAFAIAGQDINASMDLITGIANAAAFNGATPQQMENGMRVMGQIEKMPYVLLRQWRELRDTEKIVNTESEEILWGMGEAIYGEKFMNSLLNKYGAFDQTLGKGKWLTKEMMNDLLYLYTGNATEDDLKIMAETYKWTDEQIASFLDLGEKAAEAATKVRTFSRLYDVLKEAAQSTWTESWRLIIGDFEEATELWTSVNDVLSGLIGVFGNARNNFLQEWRGFEYGIELNEYGEEVNKKIFYGIDGRYEILRAINNILTTISAPFRAFSKAWSEVINPLNGQVLAYLCQKFADFTELFVPGENLVNSFATAIKILLSVIKLPFTLIGGIAKAVLMPFMTMLGSIPQSTDDVCLWVIHLWTLTQNFISDAEVFIYKITKGVENISTAFAAAIGWLINDILNFDPTNMLTELNTRFWALMETLGLAKYIPKSFDELNSKLDELRANAEQFLKDIGVWDKLPHTTEELVSVCENVKSKFTEMLETVGGAASLVVGIIAWLVNDITAGIDNLYQFISGDTEHTAIEGFFIGLANAATKMSEGFDKAKTAGENFWNFISGLGNTIWQFISGVWNGIKNTFTELTAGMGAMDFNDVAITAIFAIFLKKIADFVDTCKGVPGLIEEVTGAFEGLTKTINAVKLKQIAYAVAALAVGLLVLSCINADKVDSVLIMFMSIMAGIMGLMSIINYMTNSTDLKESAAKALQSLGITQLATAIVEIAVALLIISAIPQDRIADARETMAMIMVAMAGVVYVLNKYGTTISWSSMLATGAMFVDLAISMVIIAGALAIIALIPQDMLTKAGICISAMMALLSFVAQSISGATNMLSTGAGLLLFTTGIFEVALAITILSLLPVKKMWSAVGAVVTIIGALTAATKFLSGSEYIFMEIGVVMTLMGAALIEISLAMAILATIAAANPWYLVGAVVAVIAIIAALTASMVFLQGGEFAGIVGVGGAMALLAGGMLLLAIALKVFSTVPWQAIVGGMVTFGIAIGTLIALAVFMPGIGAAMMPIAAAIAALGGGVAALSIGILLLGPALLVLLSNLMVIGAAIINLIGLFFVKVVPAVIKGIGWVIVMSLRALLKFLLWISDNLTSLTIWLLGKLGLEVLQFIRDWISNIPLLNWMTDGINTLMDGLESVVSKQGYHHLFDLGDSAGEAIGTGVISGVEDSNVGATVQNVLGEQMASATDPSSYMEAYMNASSIGELTSASTLEGLDAGSLYSALGYENMEEYMTALQNGSISVEQLTSVISSNSAEAMSMPDLYAEQAKTNVSAYTGEIIDSETEIEAAQKAEVRNALSNSQKETDDAYILSAEANASAYASGLTDPTSKGYVVDASGVIIDSSVNAIKSKDNSDKLTSTGEYLTSGIAKGSTDTTSKSVLVRAASSLFTCFKSAFENASAIESPSKEMWEDGRYLAMGLAKGSEDNAWYAENAGKSLANTAIDAANNAISSISEIISGDMNTAPVITPVVDLSQVKQGADAVTSMFNNRQTASIYAQNELRRNTATGGSETLEVLNKIYRAIQNGSSVTIDGKTVIGYVNRGLGRA